ncbi:gamma-glutamyl kinase [Ruegeria sp.]|uniref:gamma-glutamyl kinase n=1 Tax=Ruegeria sp. TaxID=1879320 RepID=UPI003C7DF3AE
MLVFYEERLAFLSVPKTGSSAYLTALRDRADMVIAGPPELKHATVRRYDRFFQHIFQKMFDTEMEILAVVREPIDWLGSWYRYRSRPELDGHPNSTTEVSFEAFVQAYLRKNRPAFADVGSQTEFFQTRSNGAGATHVFKYESQDKILNFLENRLGCSIQLPQENVSPKQNLTLSPAVEKQFRRDHAAEFQLHASAQ